MFGMPEDIGLFPHMPLISKLLHGYNGSELIDPSYYKDRFFDTAPPCGAHYYDFDDWDPPYEVIDTTAAPWHCRTLLCPHEREFPARWRTDGDYPMLDYMIMYNAYLCDYYDDPKPYIYVT